MKTLTRLLTATLLLISADSLLAEENMRFSFEIGSPRGECNSRYAGSTADALGCSAIPPAARTDGRAPMANSDSGESGVLELAQLRAGDGAVPARPATWNPGQFWVMANGEALDFGQVILSALNQRPALNALGATEQLPPAKFPVENTLASNQALEP